MGASTPVADRSLSPEADGAGDDQRWLDDVECLAGLASTWHDLDATAIAESVLETLLEMLELDVVAIRFSGTEHFFLRASANFTGAHSVGGISGVLNEWLNIAPDSRPPSLSFSGAAFSVVAVSLGSIASVGTLVAVSPRRDFPSRSDRLRLGLAATQASLACREVRERADRNQPVDMRRDRPTGAALAESEWRLNLIINTIPAMAWSATPDGLLDFVNQHFCDFVGLDSAEILGLGFYRIFHPYDMPNLLSEWQGIMSSKRPREVEGRLLRADGAYRWCTLRQNALLDAAGQVIKWYGVVFDIEDRKRAEDALREAKAAHLASEQNLDLIINSLPVLVWSARPDGSADFINKSWLDYAGTPAERILEWGFLDLYHPDDAPGMVEIWKRDLEHADHTFIKGRILGADGTYHWFYFSGRKITDASGIVRWLGVNVDIEDLQRAEDALRTSEEALRNSEAALRHSEHQLSLAINTIPAMTWSATPDGRVDFHNQNLVDYVGLPFEELVDFGFYQIFHPDDLALMRETWEEVLVSKKGRPVDGRIRRFDGQYRWFTLLQNALLDVEGNVVKWYGIIIDIEDRRRAEEELRQAQSDLAHVSRMMTMGELAVSIAHEVNQPLMAIVTNASTSLRWLDNAQLNLPLARQAVERIVHDGHRAGDIVTSIRALARKSAPNFERLSLEPVILAVLDLLKGEVQSRGIVVRTEFAQRRTEIFGDQIQLQQVILNLVMNAVEAMTAFDAKLKVVTIRTSSSSEWAEVSVLDNGPGLHLEEKDLVFGAFFSTKPEGIGMGLSICRSIIEAHGGSIQAMDNLPQGSVFRFTVPLADRAPAHAH